MPSAGRTTGGTARLPSYTQSVLPLDFGIVLGCKFYIKEIRNAKLAEKEPGLKEGDTVLRINGQSVDGVTLEDATKWLER